MYSEANLTQWYIPTNTNLLTGGDLHLSTHVKLLSQVTKYKDSHVNIINAGLTLVCTLYSYCMQKLIVAYLVRGHKNDFYSAKKVSSVVQ